MIKLIRNTRKPKQSRRPNQNGISFREPRSVQASLPLAPLPVSRAMSSLSRSCIPYNMPVYPGALRFADHPEIAEREADVQGSNAYGLDAGIPRITIVRLGRAQTFTKALKRVCDRQTG